MAPTAPKELTPDPAKVRRRRRPPRYRRSTFFFVPRVSPINEINNHRPRPVFGALPSAPRRRLTFPFKSPSQGPAEFIIDTEPGRGGVLASTPAYFKIKTADGKDWLALKTHTRHANGTFQIENYVREDEKNKSQGQVLVTMGETKVTEVKFGKELGEGDDFYLRGPMTKNQSKDFPKRGEFKKEKDADGNKIPTEDNVKWQTTDKYTCYDWYGYVHDNKNKRPGNGQWYRMKYQVKSEAPFTMQDGAVYTLKCEETGWLRQIWVIQKPTAQTGNVAYTERQLDTVEQTWTLVDAHGKTMHTWKNPVNYKPRKPQNGQYDENPTEPGCNGKLVSFPEWQIFGFGEMVPNLAYYKQLQATSEAPGMFKSEMVPVSFPPALDKCNKGYAFLHNMPPYGIGFCAFDQQQQCPMLYYRCFTGCSPAKNPYYSWSAPMSVKVEDGADAALSLAIAYAMAENCVAVGPIPNTQEQDVYPKLKQKKKNAEDPIVGVDEAFARGLPESDFMFKPYRAMTGIADPYKEMTPW